MFVSWHFFFHFVFPVAVVLLIVFYVLIPSSELHDILNYEWDGFIEDVRVSSVTSDFDNDLDDDTNCSKAGLYSPLSCVVFILLIWCLPLSSLHSCLVAINLIFVFCVKSVSCLKICHRYCILPSFHVTCMGYVRFSTLIEMSKTFLNSEKCLF